MRRREVLKGLVAAPFGARQSALGEPAQQRESWPPAPTRADGSPLPNILWVCPDSVRYDTIQGLNNDYIHTPNLRKFMEQSVTFTHAVVQNPVCSPSRASFLTGRYPHTTGLRANGQRIRSSERLVTRMLADYDYACGLVGKLHLSPGCGGEPENRIDDGYSQTYFSLDLEDRPPARNLWLEWLHKQGIQWPKHPPNEPAWGVPIESKYSQTAWCAHTTIEFMKRQRNLGPWLMSDNAFQPHHPFWPVKEYLDRYDPAKLPSPAYQEGELETKSLYQRVDHQGAYGGTGLSFAKTDDLTHRKITAAYYAMIEEADFYLGKMLDALEATGQAENTIVIYHSDHGELLGDHGMYNKGPHFYEPSIRVPLIIRWPGHYKAGLRCDALVEMADLAPTLLEACDIPISPGVQGKSLTKLLRGETTDHRESVYCEYYDSCAFYNPAPMATMVRTASHKLITYHSLNFSELYDLETDPHEFKNLWNEPSARDVREAMMAELTRRMAGTVDPLPVRADMC